jgi:tetratricopeptide (TPR) repeat protein
MAEGVAQLSPALALPERGPASTAALAQVQHAVASLLYHRRDLAESARFADAGLASAERCHDRRLQFGCLATLGACHSTGGRWQQAAPLFERALSIARADGERGETARALADLGVIAKKEGEFDLALDRYSQALAINRELGRHADAARCLNNIGVLWMERNQWAHARDVMKEGVALCERHGIDSLLPYLQNGLGLALFELGELDAAERQLERALQRSRATEVLSVELLCNCLLARVATRHGRHDAAESRFRAAARLARQLDVVTDLLDIALYYAECQRDSGRRVDAARTWAVVCSHPNAEAGIRASAAHWAEALALDDVERAALASGPATLDQVIDRLLATGDAAGPTAGKR